jgi:flagellar biogenesis protein FliO
MDVFDGDLLRQSGAVLVVFGLLAMAAWKLRAGPVTPPWNRSVATMRLESRGRLSLTPSHAVHLVRIDGQELVVATHPQGCSLLWTASQEPRG